MLALINGFIIYPLPPSPTFFDGFGRIGLGYSLSALTFWLVLRLRYPFRHVSYSEVLASPLIIMFFGMIGALIVEAIRNYLIGHS